MIRIGIVGAENSHSAAIAKTLNVDHAVGGCRVAAIWGRPTNLPSRPPPPARFP